MSKESIRDLTIKALKAALEVNSMEWISVKDRLPQKNKSVLMVRNGSVEIGFYNAKDARFCVPNENAFDGWPIPVDGVSHWIPLPEPPNEGVNFTQNQGAKTILGELYVCIMKLESDAIRSKRETYRIPGELDELRGQEKAYSSARKAILDFMEKYCGE